MHPLLLPLVAATDIAAYSDAVVTCFLTRVDIPAQLRTPWAAAIWKRCTIELEQDATSAPPVPAEQWQTMHLRWSISGRVQAVWPGAKKQRQSRASVSKSADASLDTRALALELGLQETECPACRGNDTSMKHYSTDAGVSRWKHHHASCGEAGGASRLATLVLGDEAAEFLSARCGNQTEAPVLWPVAEVSRVLDDPEEQDEDDADEDADESSPKSVSGDAARLSQTDVAQFYQTCLPIQRTSHSPGFEVTDAPLFSIPAHVIVCPVNTQGVMGRGVAKAVRDAFPAVLEPYRDWCQTGAQGALRVDTDGRIILCCATKVRWEDPSTLELVTSAVDALIAVIQTLGPVTVAVPLLGCGAGGLSTADVLPLLERLATGQARIVVSTSDQTAKPCAAPSRVDTFAASRSLRISDGRSASACADDIILRAVLPSTPAIATPIRDSAGHIRNVQLRFMTPVVQGRFKGKTRFLNSGNPGATEAADGMPYVYGDPTHARMNRRRTDGRLVPIVLGEGWGDYHALQTVLGISSSSPIVITALEAGSMPRIGQTLALPLDRAVRVYLIIPHRDKPEIKTGVSKGLQAGDKLLDALCAPTIPNGGTLAATGRRDLSELGWSFAQTVNFALDCINKAQPAYGISGMARGWDQAVAQAFCIAGVPWTAAVPFRGHGAMWPAQERQLNDDLLEQATSVEYVSSGGYTDDAMQRRNLWMEARATATLALWDGKESGGTWHYLSHTKKPVWNCWNVAAGNYRILDWSHTCDTLGIPDVAGLDANDVLMRAGEDRMREYLLSLMEV